MPPKRGSDGKFVAKKGGGYRPPTEKQASKKRVMTALKQLRKLDRLNNTIQKIQNLGA